MKKIFIVLLSLYNALNFVIFAGIMPMSTFKILPRINSPEDLKKLNRNELLLICSEIREYIIDVVSKGNGHLGASLGMVELAIALHYVFNTPEDRIIWDVGHQAYAHKIITGRRDAFQNNRKFNGISGFPRRSESEYDAFGVGHSSTSISAALGMAIAAKLEGKKNRQHIAVIGDGSMTGGMAFEALNHAGVSKSNLLVILNDNGIAIDENVGALKEYLTTITTSRTYNKIKDKIWHFLGDSTRIGHGIRTFIQKIENAVKLTIFRKSNVFESLNFRYFGPIDGHDLSRMLKILDDLKHIPGPKLLHIITVKGKGYEQAEKQQTKFHAPGNFDVHTGQIIAHAKEGNPLKYQIVFGETITALAAQNPLIVGVTPAMATGCSLNIMMEKFPERTFDVGIAEQHAVTFSAGMAVQGFIPFCNIYSTFLQRAYDQVIHDVALQQLPVVLCIDRGGLVGEDGATHHGAYDLAFLRSIPNCIIASPLNEIELRNLMFTAQLNKKGLFAIRYPKGEGVIVNWQQPFQELIIGKGEEIKKGNDIAIISIGHVGNFAIEACNDLEREGIRVGIYNMRFLKPIDKELLHYICKNYKVLITIEDGTIVGGLGSAVSEFITAHGYFNKLKTLGIPDVFIEHGTREELIKECGYDKDAIMAAIKELV